MAEITLSDVKEIKDTVYQNTVAYILATAGLAGFVYLLAFDDVDWVYDKYIAAVFVAIFIVMNIFAFITGKEIEKFLTDNPKIAKALENKKS